MFSIARRLALTTLLCLVGSSSTTEAQSFGMVEFFTGGKYLRGGLLYRSHDYAMILGSDGRLHDIEGQNVSRVHETGKPFQPDSTINMRAKLRSEYGNQYEVIATDDFLVVQPNGRGNRWPGVFQESHDAFVHYMTQRGVRTNKGNFPMVAIVSPDETAMRLEFKKHKIDVGRVLGVYHPYSNRVMTHDGGDRGQTYATVRHEAAHQSGYNTGVHSRINDTPKWITEGVGQLFEPASMTTRRRGAQRSDRVNEQALAYLKENHADRIRFVRDVQSIVRHDELFSGNASQIGDAYCVAWAMMFYLGERDHRRFAEFLNTTSARPPFVEYPPSQRQNDFETITGTSTEKFALRVHRFIESL